MPRHPMTLKRVVYETPGTQAVTVRCDIPYRGRESAALTMDVYVPPHQRSGQLLPAVVFVLGYSDRGAGKILGCRFKEMQSYVSWAQLIAASGLIAVTYETGPDPVSDASALLDHVRREAEALGIDRNEIALWACSGNAPTALSLVRQPYAGVACAVLLYPFTFDLDGDASVARAAGQWHFADAAAGCSIADLPRGVPLFIARAGPDEMPHLNTPGGQCGSIPP